MTTKQLWNTFAAIFVLFFAMLALPQKAQAQEKEAYVVKSEDGKTLTFYYDTQRDARTGTTYGIGDTNDSGSPIWGGRDFENKEKIITHAVFDASFKDYRPTNTRGWFNYCEALSQITGMENLNTSEVTDMSRMFEYCSSLASLDLTSFNTANVTNMSYMFSSCQALTSLDLKSFNTEKVTSMRDMFFSCSSLTSLDLSNFNTANVTNMSYMFDFCRALTSLDLSSFNTVKVTDMSYMFDYCTSLVSIDLKNFNTEKVTDMSCMFYGCSSLASLDLSSFNTANVTDMGIMFKGCSGLGTIYCNDTWSCDQSQDMFTGCSKLVGAVAFDADKSDATMANPETGYFTKKETGEREAYVEKSTDSTTLTFYYDSQRNERTGTTYGIFDRQGSDYYLSNTFPA